MRSVTCAAILVCMTGFASAQAEGIWLFFSPTPGDVIPPEWTSQTNPVLAGPATVYLWARTEQSDGQYDIWNGIALSIDADVTGFAYNPYSEAGELHRWNEGSDVDWSDDDMFGVSVDQMGLGATADPMRVQGSDERFFPVAELNFPAGYYDVRLDTSGLARKGGSPESIWAHMGFGDPPVPPNLVPDLYIVPEPGALAILAIVLWAVRRR